MNITYEDIIEIFGESQNDFWRNSPEITESRSKEYVETILTECVPDNLDCPRMLESEIIRGL